MRILHVITRLILGGAQQNTVLSCAAQAAAGHDAHLAFGPIHGPEGSLLQEAQASGATLHEIPNMVRELSPRNDWQAFQQLRQLLHQLQPDLVHSHSSKAGILTRAAAWKQRALTPLPLGGAGGGRPTILHTVHGLPFHSQQKPLTHKLYIALEKYAAKRCDHLIAITPAMADAFVEKKIAPRKKLTVIPSGVDLARFDTDLPPENAKKKLGIDPAIPVVGLVARLDPLKGHRDLIAALPAITHAFQKVQVLFVGDGFDRTHIEQAVANSPHRDRITMLHLVPFEQMPTVYRAIDVCALPSFQEGQSRVLVEALAAGCGIVAYDVGGIPSVCIDHDTGLLVPLGDTAALADALVFMLKNPEKRHAMTRRGQAHVQQHFSAEKMNRELIALYDSALAPGSHA